ncbi:hypothetical protein NPIL_142311, partial [Nephila pilipes]
AYWPLLSVLSHSHGPPLPIPTACYLPIVPIAYGHLALAVRFINRTSYAGKLSAVLSEPSEQFCLFLASPFVNSKSDLYPFCRIRQGLFKGLSFQSQMMHLLLLN